jgi:hypothetical protein
MSSVDMSTCGILSTGKPEQDGVISISGHLFAEDRPMASAIELA